jgi:hypothetical protein
MMIKSDKELRDAVDQASALLQEITDYTGRKARNDAVVRFPRRFLRTAAEHRDRLKFISDKTVRANLSYTLMMSDVVYWTLIRTDLSGMAHEMLIKLFVFIGVRVCQRIQHVDSQSMRGRVQAAPRGAGEQGPPQVSGLPRRCRGRPWPRASSPPSDSRDRPP